MTVHVTEWPINRTVEFRSVSTGRAHTIVPGSKRRRFLCIILHCCYILAIIRRFLFFYELYRPLMDCYVTVSWVFCDSLYIISNRPTHFFVQFVLYVLCKQYMLNSECRHLKHFVLAYLLLFNVSTIDLSHWFFSQLYSSY
jgi:hypothetical protein